MSNVENTVDVASVVSKSSLKAKITVKFTDGTSKTLNVSEGDQVKNLTYVADGGVHTVSGEIKVIGYNASTVKTGNSCVHSTESDFSKKVAISNFIIDCSTQFNSDLRTIPVAAIRDFDTDDEGDMIISDVKYSDGVVTFVSTVTPAAVLWNNEVIIPTQNDPTVDVYTATVSTMNKVNTLTILDSDNRVKILIDGVDPIIENSATINNNVATVIAYINDTLCNKYTDNSDVSVNDGNYYVEVASEIGRASTISINGEEYSDDENIPLNIGGNSAINKPAFKMVGTTLSIGAVAFIHLVEEGLLNITVNGFDIIIPTEGFSLDVTNEVPDEKDETETGDDQTEQAEPSGDDTQTSENGNDTPIEDETITPQE